jgi:hypothetical protein
MNKLIDKLQVIDAVNKIVNTADNKQWQECIVCFTEMVEVDHGSDKRVGPIMIQREKLVESWIEAFKKMSFTWHQITNHEVVIEVNKARCTSKVIGLHVGIDKTTVYTTWGNYRHELEKTEEDWRISSVQYVQLYEQGNPDLFNHQ